ncbi:MAG TPA: FGGY family carbohydrate kinase [Acidimicrobiales bacterium]|nr:FGGY family carbohydrate kinase [Acidimicrobiales bacterium]
MTFVAGIDSSTQSTKVVVCDAEDGRILRQASAPHPDGTEIDPAAWWSALEAACAGGVLDGVEALAAGGQQHGMVVLDGAGSVIRPALLWNDVRSAPDAAQLVADLGGPAAWAEAVGSVPVASFTVTKLRWLAAHEPGNAGRVESVCLPHDWLTWCLGGGGAPGGGGPALVTDRGDASGTGYWSPAEERYREDLLDLALGHGAVLPRVAAPGEAVGEARRLAPGALLAPGTGDNMAAALGLGMGPGDVVVSLGTSGTVYLVADAPSADASGLVAGFADATGRFLPLACTLNAARVLTTVAALLGVDSAGLDALALSSSPGAGGLTLLPFLDGERTPDLPEARGLLGGITRANATPAHLARAAVEGVLCGMAGGLEALEGAGHSARRGLLVGGAARSGAVQALAPTVLGLPFALPDPSVEWVARGAARQAAWALSGKAEPPEWPVPAEPLVKSTADPELGVRATYRQLLDDVLPALRRPAPGL